MAIDRIYKFLVLTCLCGFLVGCGSGQLEPDPEQEAELATEDYEADMEAPGEEPTDE